MNLTFNQVEAVFAARFDIPAERAVAFRGRLQHFQRLKFPSGVNTGRGTKATYGWVQVIQLMVALDLIDLGLTPDLATRSVRQNSDRLIGAVHMVVTGFGSTEALVKALMKARCPFGITQFAVASVFALTLPRGDDQGALIMVQTGREFTEQLNKDPAVEPAAILINLGARLMLVGQHIGRCAGLEPIEVATDLMSWSSEWANEDSLS
ncbi:MULTISPECIES: hypothetical protein [Sphingomonas]|uniref:hypothetical protein n=1 Tax=Sphingomonas TaxID=13687 RepID=UPI000DEF80E8|nr:MULTISPECIES: hypothetical protein [Sphingomonas]